MFLTSSFFLLREAATLDNQKLIRDCKRFRVTHLIVPLEFFDRKSMDN